jgi:hypothetical protein
VEAVQEQLALAAVLYARVELGLVEPADLERYGRRYPQGDEPGPAAAARESLRRTVAAWAGTWRIPPEGAVRLFDVALERVAQRAAMR